MADSGLDGVGGAVFAVFAVTESYDAGRACEFSARWRLYSDLTMPLVACVCSGC